MRIVVYDVAAESGGAMVVLRQFYEDVIHCDRSDIHWFFVVSQDVFQNTDNATVMCFPNVKRSWIHRLEFENTEIQKILNELKPDLLISLQNMPITGCACPQYVYLHQSLQFCPKHFSILRREEREMAIRQKLIGNMIRFRLPKAKHIFVQTQWIREACAQWISYPKERIHIVHAALTKDALKKSLQPYTGQHSRVFFYPARAELYKNHDVILDACKILNKKGIRDYRVVFTISLDANSYAKRLRRLAEGFPVQFIGFLSYDQVWDYYQSSILLFPSYLETCGLPLLEARQAGARILASDMPFAHEALDGYENVEFFPYQNAQALAECMMRALESPDYVAVKTERVEADNSLMAQMIRVFEEDSL